MITTYVPLYRKYRPQTFNDLVGQEALSQTLCNAITQNKVAHAYLFTGPRGTGKTSAARILAKSLNCDNGPTVSPCGVCSSCKDITSGNALDVIEIDAASNNKVEDARDLIDRVQFAPVAGRYKVYIIDEVHMLTSQAFNTLLKTLEEPPKNLVFILATTESHKVLETIISRCQRFDFRRISQDIMVARLRYIAEQERVSIDDEALNLIARRSAGGLRDALGLLDQISVLSNVAEVIGVKDVLNLIGALPEDMLIDISDAIATRDGASALTLLNKLMNLGNEPLQIVKELTIHFRNLLIAATVEDNLKDIIDASEEFFDDLKKISKLFKKVEIAQIIDKLAYAERMIRNTTQPILWLEVGLLSICYRHEIVVVEDLQKRVEELECIVATGNIPPELTLSCSRKATPIREHQRPVPQPAKSKEVAPVRVKPEPPLIAKVEEVKPEKVLIPQEPVEIEVEKKQSAVEQKDEPVQDLSSVDEKIEIITSNEPVKQEDVVSYSVDDTWKAIVNSISSPSTKGLLNSLSVPMAITSEEVVVGFAQEWIISDIKKQNRLEMLESAVEKVLGKRVPITFKVISEQDHKKSQKKTSNIVEKPKDSLPVNSVMIAEKPSAIATEESNVDDVEEKQDFIEPQIQEHVFREPEQEFSEQVKLVQDLFQGKVIDQ